MADFVFNVAKGRVAELANRVNNNDPTNSAMILLLLTASAADATAEDYDTLSAVLGDAGTTEASDASYSRLTVTSLTVTTDDTNDRVDVDMADQTFTALDNTTSTDLIIAYDSDTTGGTDANIEPLTQHDFAVTATGTDVTAQIANFFRAS